MNFAELLKHAYRSGKLEDIFKSANGKMIDGSKIKVIVMLVDNQVKFISLGEAPDENTTMEFITN